ncbi:MAG TPA: alcohol dehydrogenase catalytic domain-containing protein, partial [Candidatus Obscuribacter sp.]|nr:alcohol dehydrogenase catalytic domain-containing protein [Candidatus Obscuribacter sp.]
MKALVKNRNSVQVVNTAAPKITREDDVLLQVALAGLCRTDIYAATGKLKVKDPLVLGHELAGV